MPRLLLLFPPLSPPTAPPLGIAQLKASVQTRVPTWEVRRHDANLDLFNRTLDGGGGGVRVRWCESCGRHGLACALPSSLTAGGRGEDLHAILRTPPTTTAQRDNYITAAREFDQLFFCLRTCLEETLVPFIEGRGSLDGESARAIFGGALDEAEAYQPDMVGISVLGETGLTSALALAALLKDRHGLPVMLGGALMSHLDPRQLLEVFPFVDVIFEGEAEDSLPGLLEGELDLGRHKGGGLYYKNDGEVVGGPLLQRPAPGGSSGCRSRS